MKQIVYQFKFKGKGFIFGDTNEVMPMIKRLLDDNPTLHGPLTHGFDTLVDVFNTLWFVEDNDHVFFILAPSHYVPSNLGKQSLTCVKHYNDVSAGIHDKRFIFADVYDLIADVIESEHHLDYVYMAFNAEVDLNLYVHLEYSDIFSPVTVIGPKAESMDIAELFMIDVRPPSPYIRAPKPADYVPFKYLYDPYRSDQKMFELNVLREVTCSLCAKAHAFLYIDYEEPICPPCFKNRKAYRLDPIITALNCHTDKVIKLSREQKSELARTPMFSSWQDPVWKVCCNDYCQFIQRMDAQDFADSSIAIQQVIINNLGENADSFAQVMSKSSGPTGYLFQCLRCKTYHFYHDTD